MGITIAFWYGSSPMGLNFHYICFHFLAPSNTEFLGACLFRLIGRLHNELMEFLMQVYCISKDSIKLFPNCLLLLSQKDSKWIQWYKNVSLIFLQIELIFVWIWEAFLQVAFSSEVKASIFLQLI